MRNIFILLIVLFVVTVAKDGDELQVYINSAMWIGGLFIFAYIVYFVLKKNKSGTKQKNNFPFSIYSKVVGVSYDNDDGSSRQENIKKYLKEGDELFIKGYNYKGKPALAILARENSFPTQIGHVKADLVEDILNLDPNTELEIRVKNLTGGTKEKPTRGVNIEIFTTNEI